MTDKIIKFNGKQVKPVEIKKGEFDFNHWSKLAKQDPEAFEAAREAEIHKHIASLGDESAQQRMRSLQWRIDMERKRSSSPLDAAARIYDMMWESVGRNIKALDDLTEIINPIKKPSIASASVKKENKQNTILNFKRKEMETAMAE